MVKTNDHDAVCAALAETLSKTTNLIKFEDVLEVANIIKEQIFDDARFYVDRFFISLLLAASVPVGTDPSLGLKLLAESDSLLGSKEVSYRDKLFTCFTTLLLTLVRGLHNRNAVEKSTLD